MAPIITNAVNTARDLEQWTASREIVLAENWFSRLPSLFDHLLRRARLQPEDLVCTARAEIHQRMTVEEMLMHGVPLFHALIFKSISTEIFGQVVIAVDPDHERISATHYKQSFGLLVMHLLLRGTFPLWREGEGGDAMHCPTFIKNIYNIGNNSSEHYTRCMILFPIAKIGFTWLRAISFTTTEDLFRNRIINGVAGYRLLRYVATNVPALDHPAHVRTIYTDLYSFGPSWDIHPLTRSDEFNRAFPAFSRTLGIFIRTYYSPAQIESAVSQKLLFRAPDTGVFDFESLPRNFALGNKIFLSQMLILVMQKIEITSPSILNAIFYSL